MLNRNKSIDNACRILLVRADQPKGEQSKDTSRDDNYLETGEK